MDVQGIIVGIFFIIALIYIGRVVYRNIKPEKGCGQCGKCGVDFSDIKLPKS